MKLKVTDWKHAWFESHISERFFQEMSRLEKGPVQGLDTSAQWMEQVMIDVGALAQAMIRLEHEGPTETQLRQACDKAMRLAALSLHLITALDVANGGTHRAATAGRSNGMDWAAGRAGPGAPPAPPRAQEPEATPAVDRPEPPRAPPAAAGPVPTTTAQLLARNAAQRPAPEAPDAGSEAGREVARSVLAPADAAAVEASAAAAKPPLDGSLFASLLQVSGRQGPQSESHLRQTILSLAQQGLSRAEIEMVTGEPRHIVEAVLNHGREQQAARQG